MLISHIVQDVPELGARLEDHYLFNSFVGVTVLVRDGVRRDGGLWPRKLRRTSRQESNAIVVLSGELGIRCLGKEWTLREGDCLLMDWESGWSLRETQRCLAMVVEWVPGIMGDAFERPASLRLAPHVVARARMIARSLMQSGYDPVAAAAGNQELLQLLRNEGLRLERAEFQDLLEEGAARDRNLIRDLDTAFSQLHAMPDWFDISKSAPSLMSARRALYRLLHSYRFSGSGWRELRSRHMLGVAFALMGSPKATTETVARIAGYSSPTALCRAFAAAGLPSPGSIRSLIGSA